MTRKCFLEILLVAILVTANLAYGKDVPANPLKKPGWKLDFHDEFDGPELNDKVWLPYYLPHLTTRERAAADYEFRDDAIVIKIEKDHPVYRDTWPNKKKGHMLVSSIQTFEKDGLHAKLKDGHHEPVFDGYTTKYGYFEIRAKIPGGSGGHMAWWMVWCQDKPNQNAEIDIVENPFHITANMYVNIHAWNDPSIRKEEIRTPLGFDIADTWHVYGFQWDRTGMKFYVDNILMGKSSNSPAYRMATILGFYRNCGWDGPNDGIYPKELAVDYFRVYKKLDPLLVSALSAETIDVYFGTSTLGKNSSEGIYRSVLDMKRGKLSEPVLAAKAANPTFIEFHPNGKFLYAVSELGKAGSVGAYVIDGNTKKLKFLNQQPSGGRGPCHVSLDHTGTNVLVANYSGGSASVIPIKQDGSLAKPTAFVKHAGSSVNEQRQEGPHAHSINVSPDNRFAFVADLGIDKIMVYRLDVEKGTLATETTAQVKLKPGAGPRHLSFSPDGKRTYVINELDCTITSFAYNAESGILTEEQTVATLPKGFEGSNTCAEVRVHPNGKFLYGSNRGHDSIVVYKIDPDDGKLTYVEHETGDIKTPRNFNIDPTGKFCLVANRNSDSVVVFSIDQKTGKLNPTGHRVSIKSPLCVRFLVKTAEEL